MLQSSGRRRRRYSSLLALICAFTLTALSVAIGQPLPALAAAPTGPASGVTVTATAAGSADLSWGAANFGANTTSTYSVLLNGNVFSGCSAQTARTCHVTGPAGQSTVTLAVRALGDNPAEYVDSSTVSTTLLPPPDAPRTVAATVTASGQATVTWTAPASWHLSNSRAYTVLVDTVPVGGCQNITALSCAITGSSGPHAIIVRALGNTGLSADATTNFTFATAPAAPTGLHLTASDAGTGTLAWTAPNFNGNLHQGYTVLIDGNPADGCVDITATTCAFTADSFSVSAKVTAIGDVPTLTTDSQPVALTLLPAPAAPNNIVATNWGVGSATVSWAPPSFNGSTNNSYTVLVAGSPVCTNITATSCVVTGSPDSTVVVTVRAIGDPGLMTDSAPASILLPDLPDAPTSVAVTSRALGHTVIGWVASSSWHRNATHTYTVLVGGSPVAGCTAIVGLTCDIPGGADSTVSVVVSAVGNTAALHNDAAPLSVDIPAVPDAPTNLHTTATTAGGADIAWTAPNWRHNTNRTYAVAVTNGTATCTSPTVATCHISGSAGATASISVTAVGDDPATLTSLAATLSVKLIAAPTGTVGAVTVTTTPGSGTVTVGWASTLTGNGGTWSGGSTNTYQVVVTAPAGATLSPNGCSAVSDPTTSCTFTTDTDGNYSATVTPVNEAGTGSSRASSPTLLVLHTPTGAVDNLAMVTTPGSGNVTVSWNAANVVWHGATSQNYALQVVAPGGATLTSNTCTGNQLASAPKNCGFTTDTAGAYSVHVTPVSEAGTSSDVGTTSGTVALAAPAVAVTALSASAVAGHGVVSVQWTGIAAGAWAGVTHHYVVTVAKPSGAVLTDNTCTLLATSDATSAASCTFTTDTAGDYTVTVASANEVGTGASAAAPAAHVTLSAPTGSVAGLATTLNNMPNPNTVHVTWTQLADANWHTAATRQYTVTVTPPNGVTVASGTNTCTTVTDSSTPSCTFVAAGAGDYQIQVVPHSEAGDGDPASTTKHVTLNVPTGTVTGVTVTNTPGSGAVTVSWPQLADAGWSLGATRSYAVTAGAAALTANTCASVTDSATPSCTFTTTTAGPLTVTVTAVNEVGPAAGGTNGTGNISFVPTATVASVVATESSTSPHLSVTWGALSAPSWRGGLTQKYHVTVDKPAGGSLANDTCTVADLTGTSCTTDVSIGGDYVVHVTPITEAGLGTGVANSNTAHVVLKPTATVTGLRVLPTAGQQEVVVIWNSATTAGWNGSPSTHNYILTITPPQGTSPTLTGDCTATVADSAHPSCSFTTTVGGLYTVQIALANEAGTSTSTASASGNLSLTPPTDHVTSVTVATTPGTPAVAVSWPQLTASAWQGTTHTYVVTVTAPGGAGPITQDTCTTSPVTDSANPHCTFSAVTPGSYSVRVAAANEAGTSSQYTDGSGYVTLTAPTGPVAGLTATAPAGSGTVTVAWTALATPAWNGSQTRTYLVTVDRPAGAGAFSSDTCTTGPVADTGTPGCTFTAVTPGDYTVHVLAHSEAGNSTDATQLRHVTLAAPTGTVTGLTVSTIPGSGTVTLGWTRLLDAGWSTGATRTYTVETGASNLITTSCTSVTDGPNPGCSFTTDTAGPLNVVVKAVNEVGTAATGTTGTGNITFQPTATVTGLTTPVVVGSPTVPVSWTQLGASDWRGGLVKKYRVSVDGPNGATLTANTCTGGDLTDSANPACTFAGSVGGDYTVHVAPVTEAGLSTGTAASSTAHLTLVPATAVTNLQVSGTAGTSTITASWNQLDPAVWNGGATHSYAVTVQTPANAVLSANSCTTVVDSATPGCSFSTNLPGTYTVVVAPLNEAGTSTATASASASPGLGAPDSPTAVSGTPGANSIAMSWTGPGSGHQGAGLTSYAVTATAAGYPDGTCTAPVTSSPCTIIGLAAGVGYTLHVTATGPGGTSAEALGSTTVLPTGTPVAPNSVPDNPVPAGSATVTAGGAVTITGTGFAPNSTVVLSLFTVPVPLGTATATAGGQLDKTVTIPGDTVVGSHTLLATGVDNQGVVRYLAKSITVPTPTTPPTNPPTNPPVTPPPTTPPTTAPPVVTAPAGSVTSLTATRATTTAATTVTVTWNAGQIVWGTGTTRTYTVEITGPDTVTGSCTAPVTGTTCSFTADTDGSYKVRVTATTEVDSSPTSTTTTVNIEDTPTPPTAVKGTAGVNAITVSWTAPVGGVKATGYTATASVTEYPSRTCTAAATKTTCTITGLAAGAGYLLRVVASSATGSSDAGVGSARVVPTGTVVAPAAVPGSAVPTRTVTTTPGGKVTITGTGFKAGSKVLLNLYPSGGNVGSATASSAGAITASVTIPSTASGQYTLMATGLDSGGRARFVTLAVTVSRGGTTGVRGASHTGTTSQGTKSLGGSGLGSKNVGTVTLGGASLGTTTPSTNAMSSAGLTVTTTAGTMPVTGYETGPIILTGVCLLAVGLVLMVATRRRRVRRH